MPPRTRRQGGRVQEVDPALGDIEDRGGVVGHGRGQRLGGGPVDPGQGETHEEGGVGGRGRGRGRGRGGGQVVGRNLRERTPPPPLEDDFEDEDKSLHLVGGCYGTWSGKRGFNRLTNFRMEPLGFLSSKKFLLKGNLWNLLFLDGTEAQIFVPENQQSHPQKFKYFFDTQHVEIRMKMRPSESAWRELVDRLLDAAEEKPGGYKKMYFMEKLGFQDHTADEFPNQRNKWRWQFGPNLHFTFDGKPDTSPIHFMFPTLSTKMLAPKDWKFLPFKFNTREDLKAPELIAAAPEWNFWPFMLTCALFISGSNTYFVRKRVHQHPAGIIKGGKGVTKTWSVEVIMWQLTGQRGEEKLDPGSKDSTIKRLAAYYSTPTIIEDNASSNKEETLVVSSFDACKYVTKEEMVEICSIFIFTTNSSVRGERLADRECIVEYERGNPSEEERESSTLAYQRARDSDNIAVRVTMAFGEFILTNEWMELVTRMKLHFMDVFGVKDRTARGYAVIVAALRYFYDRNEEFFLSRGHPWTEFMEEFVPGPWTKVVRLAHIELTNADAIFAAWLSGLLALIPNWSLSERKRALALATSQKVGPSRGQEAVLAVKFTEPRFRCVGGVPLDRLAKIAGELGGVADHPCSKFLAPAIELEDTETEITSINRKSARAILFPLKDVCNSQQILSLCDLLAEQEFCQLADVDTPSGNFETQDVLSSSAVEVDVSALNISDVSAIYVAHKQPGYLSTSQTPVYKCDDCDMICRNSSALQKHKGSKNCREKQRKNSTSVEDRKCLECSRFFSTTQALASHVRTHKSLNLALSVTSSPLSQSLPPDLLTPTINNSTLTVPLKPVAAPNINSLDATLVPLASVPAASTASSPSTAPVVRAALVASTDLDASATSVSSVAPLARASPITSSASVSSSTLEVPPSKTASGHTSFICDICSRSLKTKPALIKHRGSASCRKAAGTSSTPLLAPPEPAAVGSHNLSAPVQSVPVVESLNISAPATGSVVEIKCPMCGEVMVNVTAFKLHVLRCSSAN